MNQELIAKQERLARLQRQIAEATEEAQTLAHEIEVDTEELASKDPKVIWRRAYGTPLTYQALCDFFRTASPEVKEAAARHLYTFATPDKHQYAYWALRFWPYWNRDERTALALKMSASTEQLATVSISKALALDELWGRTTYHFGRCPSRSHLLMSLLMRGDDVSIAWIKTMQPWLTVPLSPAQLRKIS